MSNKKDHKINEPIGPIEVGDRIRGAFHYAHGLGENIRGGLLGAADTLVHADDNDYGAVQARGRQAMQEGKDAMKGLRPLSSRGSSRVGTSHRARSSGREDRRCSPLPQEITRSASETQLTPPVSESRPENLGTDENQSHRPTASEYGYRDEKARSFGAPPLPPRQKSPQGKHSMPGPSTKD